MRTLDLTFRFFVLPDLLTFAAYGLVGSAAIWLREWREKRRG